MKIKKIAVFSYEDLSDSSKERARADFLATDDYPWWKDAEDSIRSFCDHFGVSRLDYQIGAFSPSYLTAKADNSNFRGLKLKDYKVKAGQECNTGYWIEIGLWETFIKLWEESGSALVAFRDALDKACADIKSDMEWHQSEEYVSDIMKANDWEFNEDGSWFNGKEIAA